MFSKPKLKVTKISIVLEIIKELQRETDLGTLLPSPIWNRVKIVIALTKVSNEDGMIESQEAQSRAMVAMWA